MDVQINFDNPRSNVEAVHITLGDYFNDKKSENIYRVGFMLKNENLRTNLALKIKNLKGNMKNNKSGLFINFLLIKR